MLDFEQQRARMLSSWRSKPIGPTPPASTTMWELDALAAKFKASSIRFDDKRDIRVERRLERKQRGAGCERGNVLVDLQEPHSGHSDQEQTQRNFSWP